MHQKHIILTRDRGDSEEFVSELESWGAVVYCLPLMEITYLADAPEKQKLLERLHKAEWILFFSKHGVIGFFSALEACNVPLPPSISLAAYGESCQKELVQRGHKPHFFSFPPTGREMIEQLHKRSLLKDKRVLLSCGDQQNQSIEAALQEVGALWEPLIVYENREVFYPDEHLRARIRKGDYDLVVFTAPSIVDRFKKHFPEANLKAACIGATTAQRVVSLGDHPLVVSHAPTMHDLLQTILSHQWK